MKNIIVKNKALVYVFICVILWSLIPVVSKMWQANLDNHQFLFWSSLVSFLSFLILVLFKKKTKIFLKYKSKDWLSGIWLGFLWTYLYYILLYFWYANWKWLEILVLQYSWPIFIVIFSMIILKEKINLKKVFSIIFGFMWVFLVLTKWEILNIHFDNYFVNIIVLIAAISFSLFSVLSKKIKLETYTLLTIYFWTATIFSFISMLLLSNFSLPTKESIIPILINGILINWYSYLFWIKALKKLNASFVAPFIFLIPILSSIYLILFFEEEFLPIYLFWLLFVIIAGFLNIKK
jgi:drug/metabolite transporter (DMT)-like permease